MITAVDTNVVIDVFTADHEFGPRSADALRGARREGRLIACEVVWAEVATVFAPNDAARVALHGLGVDFAPIDEASALAAGAAWQDHRSVGGARTRVVPDFLIGAHAAGHADRLLTRDRGFYRSYFADLTILDPTAT